MTTPRIPVLLLLTAALAGMSFAQKQPAPAQAPAAAQAPAKSQPITQDEKDKFRNLRIELSDMQATFATQMLQLKTQIEDLQKKSTEDLQKKNAEAEQLYRALQARCAAPEALDLKSVECAPKKP